MKQKTHSGLKKRVKVRKSGTLSVRKSCKNHLLSNKSKRQKKSHSGGMAVHKTRLRSIRRLMPLAGKVRVRRTAEVVVEEVAKAAAKKTVKEKAPAKKAPAKKAEAVTTK